MRRNLMLTALLLLHLRVQALPPCPITVISSHMTRPAHRCRAGAYTWHRVELSEEHALRAVIGGELVVTGPNGRPIRLKY